MSKKNVLSVSFTQHDTILLVISQKYMRKQPTNSMREREYKRKGLNIVKRYKQSKGEEKRNFKNRHMQRDKCF